MALVARRDDRALRSKDQASNRIVSELEDRNRIIQTLEQAVAKKDAELKSLEEEIQELESQNESNQLTIMQFEKDHPIAPEDALDAITRKENTIKIEQKRLANLRKDVHDLPLITVQRDKELQSAEAELQNIIEVTGWCPTRKPMDAANYERSIVEIQEMEDLIRRLEDERKTVSLILRKKDALIDTLRGELERKQELEEQLNATNNSVRVADRDVREVMQEVNEKRKEHNRHDDALVAVEKSRDIVALNSLEDDVRFLQSEVDRNVQSAKDQARIIKAQQFRIDQLEARVECVMDASRNLGLERDVNQALKSLLVLSTSDAKQVTLETVLPSAETIDVELYEVLNRDLSELRNASSMKDILTLEKRATMEALARKLEIMLQSKRIEAQVFEQEKLEQEAQLLELRRQLEDQQHVWMDQLKDPTRKRLHMQRQLTKTLNPTTPVRH
eukprot:PhF_6_TR8501/c0_g1_i1/m.13301